MFSKAHPAAGSACSEHDTLELSEELIEWNRDELLTEQAGSSEGTGPGSCASTAVKSDKITKHLKNSILDLEMKSKGD